MFKHNLNPEATLTPELSQSHPIAVMASLVLPALGYILAVFTLQPQELTAWVTAIVTCAWIITRGGYEIHKLVANWNVSLPPAPDKPESYKPRARGTNHQ